MYTAYMQSQMDYDAGFAFGREGVGTRPANPSADWSEGFSDGSVYDTEYPILD